MLLRPLLTDNNLRFHLITSTNFKVNTDRPTILNKWTLTTFRILNLHIKIKFNTPATKLCTLPQKETCKCSSPMSINSKLLMKWIACLVRLLIHGTKKFWTLYRLCSSMDVLCQGCWLWTIWYKMKCSLNFKGQSPMARNILRQCTITDIELALGDQLLL